MSAADMFRMRRNVTARSSTRSQPAAEPAAAPEPTAAEPPAGSTLISAPDEAAVADDTPTPDPLRVLVVCTANISRSPLGQVILDRLLRNAGIPAAVRSAGTISTPLEVDTHSVTVAHELGLDLALHRPRKLTPEIIATDGADLIVVMEREHAREVCLIEPDAWPRTFTVKELARAAGAARSRATDARGWLADLGGGRTILDLLGEDPSDDIADTYGTSLAVHRRTAEQIEQLLGQVIRQVPKR